MKKNIKTKKLRGLWCKNGWWYFRKAISGVRRNFPLQTKCYSDAVYKALQIIESSEYNYTASLESGIIDFIEFKIRKGVYSNQSAVSRRGILLDFVKCLGSNPPLGTLSPMHIRAFFHAKKDLAGSTKDGYKNILLSFLNWCVSEKRVFLDECRKEVKGFVFKSIARKEICSVDEIQTLLNSCTDDDLSYIIICGGILGMRKNEIIHSRKAWFDFNDPVPTCYIQNLESSSAKKLGLEPFRVKWDGERRVPLNSSVLDWLRSYVGKKEHYCLSPQSRTGKHRYRYDFRAKFDRFVKKVFPSKTIGTHTLRHSFATNLAKKNIAIGAIAKYLGDSVKTTEKHYAQYLATKESVDVLKFNMLLPVEEAAA